MLAAVIITGSPPFGLFFSEMTILRAGSSAPHVTATVVFLAALVVLFCGFAYQIGRLVLGPPRDPAERRVPQPERLDLGHGDDASSRRSLAVVSAFYLPGPLLALIRAATRVVWEGAMTSVIDSGCRGARTSSRGRSASGGRASWCSRRRPRQLPALADRVGRTTWAAG